MTEENQQAIEDAPVQDAPVADNESVEPSQEPEEAHLSGAAEDEGGEGEVEFPKKAINALNRKDKKINKLRAQLRELEAEKQKVPEKHEASEINPDEYENYGDYINAQVKSLVDQQTEQSKIDMQKQQIEQQQQALKDQHHNHIIEQANEASQVFSDLPQVWQENAALLDSLPEGVTDIFYSIDNAPAAVYTLAKEGKLESLMYANPAVAAYEIINAQNKGLEALSKPQVRQSQAPTPIAKAKGTGTVKKQLSPNDDVLKSLGLK